MYCLQIFVILQMSLYRPLCYNSRTHCPLQQCLHTTSAIIAGTHSYFVLSSFKCEGQNNCYDLIPHPRIQISELICLFAGSLNGNPECGYTYLTILAACEVSDWDLPLLLQDRDPRSLRPCLSWAKRSCKRLCRGCTPGGASWPCKCRPLSSTWICEKKQRSYNENSFWWTIYYPKHNRKEWYQTHSTIPWWNVIM